MTEIQGLREQILANLDYIEFAKPTSNLNIIVEDVDLLCYNAVIFDKITRKRLFHLSGKHKSVPEALDEMLAATCLMVRLYREDPQNWRRNFGGGVWNEDNSQPPSRDRAINDESYLLLRKRKRTASAVSSNGQDEPSLAGFPRLPSVLAAGPRTLDEEHLSLMPSIGDAKLAAAACAALPPQISDNAKKLLYELITYPQCPASHKGVCLLDIMRETGLEYELLESWAKELEMADKACSIPWARATWQPKDLTGAFNF
ncbi:hypothetical protein KCU81_g7364, partial [Aureobasidium melanogenum]|uniref:Uncharacterized protein n=1 Tax=Aureobasidium melanogenum (strain CBS 110374) TaxID=1043003 RepID=A0A074WU44_AURM1